MTLRTPKPSRLSTRMVPELSRVFRRQNAVRAWGYKESATLPLFHRGAVARPATSPFGTTRSQGRLPQPFTDHSVVRQLVYTPARFITRSPLTVGIIRTGTFPVSLGNRARQ